MEAKALYDFQRTANTSVDLKAGQIFNVEQQGTNGWTMVSLKDGSQKGWVPSTYLEVYEAQKQYSTEELANGLAEALKRRS